MPDPGPNPIILYDGVCGLCNRLNFFLLRRDHHNLFRFASLQSQFARELLTRHGAEPDEIDTVYVVVDHSLPSERLLDRSDAICYLLGRLDGIWKFLGTARIMPKTVRDNLYRLVARNRYRIFGKHESCPLPDPKDRAKFVEI